MPAGLLLAVLLTLVVAAVVAGMAVTWARVAPSVQADMVDDHMPVAAVDWILANDVAPASGTFGGDRNTVHLFLTVGSGIGPATRAPVRLAVSTISVVDWSSTR